MKMKNCPNTQLKHFLTINMPEMGNTNANFQFRIGIFLLSRATFALNGICHFQ